MDNVKALCRYVCDIHGMYPSDSDSIYAVEQIVEIITTDCAKIKDAGKINSLQDDEKVTYVVDRVTSELETYLKLIRKNVSDSMLRNGWMAYDECSLADVVVFVF